MYPPVGVGQIRTSHRHDLQLAGGRIRVPRGTMLWVPHHSAPPSAPVYATMTRPHACPLHNHGALMSRVAQAHYGIPVAKSMYKCKLCREQS